MIFNKCLISKLKKISHFCEVKSFKLSCAESCTGGLLSALFTEISGSSKFFDRSFVTYSNQSKVQVLNVNPETLNNHGAVSKETAEEMVVGVKKNSNADIVVAITGIAGPEGGTLEKPVGTVYISVFLKNNIYTNRYNFNGSRSEIRISILNQVLENIENLLNKL